MPTKFEEIYGRAVFKITDDTFLTTNSDLKEAVLQQYLLASIADFQHSCRVDLNDYDLDNEQFNVELDNEIVEILALGIAYHWLDAQAMNRQLLRNVIHNKDYTSYSPANLLKEILSLRDSVEQNYRGKINTYSFRYGNIDTLKV